MRLGSGVVAAWMCCVLALASACGQMPAGAQGAQRVHGTVVDSTGAVIAGATVRLETVDGAVVLATHSGTTGGFDLTGVARGSYRVEVPAVSGFAGQTVPLVVSGPVADLRIVLALEAVQQTVQVGGDQALSTDAAENKDAVAVQGSTLEHLPIFDQDPVSTLSAFLDASASGAGGAVITVDGVEMKASTVSPSAIAEVRLNNDPYSAEFSRPGRGRIDIITKPGSPEYHGELNFIARDATFNATNYFARVKPPEQRRIYEGDLTGPVGHGGHTTFILSGGRKELDTEAAVYAFLPQGIFTQNVATPARQSQISLRVGHDFSDAHRLSVGYNFEYETNQNSGVGGLVLAEAGANGAGREDDLIVSDRIIVSPTLVNQLQLVFEKDEDVTKSVTNAPSIQVQGAFTGGGAQADLNRTENTVHINEVVSWTHGRHYVRFGANVPQISRRAVDDRTDRLGTFKFLTLGSYAAPQPQPDVFTEQRGVGRGLYWINEVAGFAQDDIHVGGRLELTVGVRYQWQTYISDKKDVAPRVSAAYALNKKTLLRTGVGIFYDRTGGDYPATFKLHNGIVLRALQIQHPGYPVAVAPGTSLTQLPTGLVQTAPGMHAPRLVQYTFGVERRLGKNLTATAGYRGMTGVDSFRSRDANAPLPPYFGARPNPALGQVQQIESGGRLRLNALDLALKGQIGEWFEGQVQYTLQRAYTNTDGLNFFPQNQYDPNAEWGRASYDRLHQFNLLGNIHPDHWLSLGVGVTLYSGLPYNETSGTDPYNTGLGNARPFGVGRNALEGSGMADLDLQWDHDFPLSKRKEEKRKFNVGVSAFDVLNHPNFSSYTGNVQSPLFGQPTRAAAGRQMQFGARYEF